MNAIVCALVALGVFLSISMWSISRHEDIQNRRIDELGRIARALCTHGESSVAVRKLPSGRIVTVRPVHVTGCALR